MIKLIIVAYLAVLQTTSTQAQITPKPTKAETKTTTVMKAPANPNTSRTKTPVSTTPPAATTPALTSWDYYLTSAKVTFYTGNDNKEKPSEARIMLSFGKEQLYSYWVPTDQYKEYAVNSTTEVVLRNDYDIYHLYDPFKLGFAESRGVKLYVFYRPNFPLDAWKIEKVILTLEFKDGNGNPHPVLGNKSIVFTNIGALLNEDHRGLACEVDQFLMPRSATVITGK